MRYWAFIQAGFAALGGWLGWILGGFDGFLITLVVFAVADYITGVMCAIVEKNLSSEIGFKGIFKKITIFAMVAAGHVLDFHMLNPTGYVGDHSAIRTAIIFFYTANEGFSLVENAARLGLPVPEKLKEVFARLRGKDDKNEPTKTDID